MFRIEQSAKLVYINLKNTNFVIQYELMYRSVILLSCFLFSLTTIAETHQKSGNDIGDTIHVAHYAIHLNQVDTDDHSISAYAEIKIVPLIDFLAYIPLELKDLTVDSLFIDGTEWNFTHTDGIIRIPLTTRKYTREDTLLVGVHYHGQPFHEDWGGFHFSGDYAFNLGVGFESIPHNLGKTWFPCVDNFTDRASYDLFVTVENEKTAVGGGLLVETIDNGDNTTTWHWKLSHPVPTYLQSVAIGNYVLYEDTYEGIEADIPINIYTRPSEADKVAGSFVHLHEILAFFEEKFGPYPFERIGYVSTAIGAMEHATNIAYPHFAINGNTSYESLLTHELSHMWFGDKVTCSSAEDMWLNEGWATFCELYYQSELYSEASFITQMRDMHNDVLKKAHIEDGGFWPLNDIPQEVTYGKTAYDKGGTVVNTLRAYLGDSIFSEAITAYLNDFAYQSASSYDMRDFLSTHTGIDMDGFFENWVFTPGTPHFSIDSTIITEGDASFMVDVFVKQKHYGYNFIGVDQIVHIAFVDENFNFIKDTVHFSGVTGHSVKIIGFEPIAVLLDPFETTNDATIDNYRFFTEAEEYAFPETIFKVLIENISDSVLIQATHHFAAPDSLKVPVEGLRISPSHYWEINGVLSGDFAAQGRFYYDSFTQLDGDLIQGENDSVVVFYRDHPRNDWYYVPQTRAGDWKIGFVYVNELKIGQYTIAVLDKQIVGIPQNPIEEKVTFYPNPTRNKIHIEFVEKGNYTVQFYNESGRLLKIIETSGKQACWKWETSDMISGILIAEVLENGKKIATERILIIK